MCKATDVLSKEKKALRFWNVAFLIAFVLLVLSNGYWMLQFLGK